MRKLFLLALITSIFFGNFSILVAMDNSLDLKNRQDSKSSVKQVCEREVIAKDTKNNVGKILKKYLIPSLIATVSLVSAISLIKSKLPASVIFASGYFGSLASIWAIWLNACINERPGDATGDGILILFPVTAILSVLGLVATKILKSLE